MFWDRMCLHKSRDEEEKRRVDDCVQRLRIELEMRKRRYNPCDRPYDFKKFLARSALDMSIRAEQKAYFDVGADNGRLYHRTNSMGSFASLTEKEFVEH